MKLRQRIFGFLALLSLAWVCYGLVATSNAISVVSESPVPTTSSLSPESSEAARNIGIGIGASLTTTFFLCSGLPFFVLFALLSWRNGVGYRRDQMHREQIEAIKSTGKPAQ